MPAQIHDMKGSGIGEHEQGTVVTSVKQVHVGDLLADFSPQFNALNLAKVTKTFLEGNRFYAIYVDPQNPSKIRLGGDEEFCVWGSEVGDSHHLYRAVSSAHRHGHR